MAKTKPTTNSLVLSVTDITHQDFIRLCTYHEVNPDVLFAALVQEATNNLLISLNPYQQRLYRKKFLRKGGKS